ncbi:MAG: GntR family transcriptional regulator [Caldilineaceae bacterium]|nr:GntR family transcriptional regulator [Caldilineaceae bacterium]
MSLASLLRESEQRDLRLDRNSLKDQSTELLRSYIISGRIPPGTKLVERELADLLGVSRMPARDALMDLEREGLVVSRPNGRYVIELDARAIDQLFEMRLVLERLAVSAAAINHSPQNCAALRANLAQMAAAIARNDRDAYVRSDLEAHQLIWHQANNPYLLKMLNSIVGPIFMFISRHTNFQTDWQETEQMHQDLADAICEGDAARAVRSIEAQMQNSVQLSYRVFAQQSPL